MTLRYLKESTKVKNHCTGRLGELLEECFVHVITEPEYREWELLAIIFYPDSLLSELKSYEAVFEQLSNELNIWLVLVRARDVLESKRQIALNTNNLEEKIVYLELQRIAS
ncbi:hypothetical protein DSM106972_050390 [Dulcicalothrix desertica PCC 7102]|uniref:Uncharacterized protein n=1 Tax=Dulcicalothrix desertica PCC 7102 TaxID=232991 RepID=A0A433VBA8_9CYAN|nr:hypothetical protein [Dulcicalothrix desertica]RUT03400.1 hypothetical protein DSM106972_050390 [Dulcicalothrix desertica PCC 7102]TWH50676.1 hypothetical protein CAL7102_05008 [Dulcicalothrix desertica PCC 7102]